VAAGFVGRGCRRAFLAAGDRDVTAAELFAWCYARRARHKRERLSARDGDETFLDRRNAYRAIRKAAVKPPFSRQPRNHRDIDRVAPRDRCQGLACSTPLDGLGALIRRELGLAADLHAIRHRPLPALWMDRPSCVMGTEAL